MKRIRLLGLALIAVFALGAMASASAMAEVEIKPNGTEKAPTEFEATAPNETTLETTAGTKVVCKAGAVGHGSFLTLNSGLALIEFKGCKGSGVECHSPGDAKEIILTLLNMQLVDVLPTATLDLGLALTPKEELPGTGDLHFTCGGILTFIILGTVIGVFDNSKGELLTSPAKGKEFKLLWKQTKGEQEIKECDFPVAFCEEGGKKKKFLLESEPPSKHELAGQLADANIVFTKEVEFIF